MKPDWDKLGSTFADHSSVVIADVDCTSSDGESVCTDNGVSGYPTIKYFTAETGKGGADYNGGRDYDSLETFVKDTLAKSCAVDTKENCDEKEIAYIEKQQGKDQESLKKEFERLKTMVAGDMKEDKKAWLIKRINILKALTGAKEEL
mmetsp:Transcript_26865/g.48829  ORF Transcript_26865/g.48829 Transcript_26865/m.48829 type:complete len:148 (-) Transcript_26865:385-828(-)